MSKQTGVAMQQRILGKTGFSVSTVTLGGGGIGMVWGATTEEECLETVKQAVASGINIIDLAPMYGKGKAEEKSPIEAVIDQAVVIACDHLVPRGFDTFVWKTLTPSERFYLKGLDLETHGEFRAGSAPGEGFSMAGDKGSDTGSNLTQQSVPLVPAIGQIVIREVGQLEHDQNTGRRFFFRFHFHLHALVKGAAACQPGHRIFIVHTPQMLDKLALSLEQLAQIIRHLIHGFRHPVQLPGGANTHSLPEIPLTKGPGLGLHLFQRLQCPPE